jgi:hypothetical protein
MADNFDLQGWMREQKQGPYAGAKGVEKVALKSSKPKSKTGLNESLMGMIDLKPVGMMSEDMEDDMDDDSTNTLDDLQLHLFNMETDYFETINFIYNNILDQTQQKAVDQMQSSGADDYDVLSYLINDVLDEGDLKQVIDHFSDLDYSMKEDGMEEGMGDDMESSNNIMIDYEKASEFDISTKKWEFAQRIFHDFLNKNNISYKIVNVTLPFGEQRYAISGISFDDLKNKWENYKDSSSDNIFGFAQHFSVNPVKDTMHNSMMSEDMEEDLPRVFLSDKDISGTSFKGQTINCSVNFLKELIGEPQYSENTGTDKTNYEWTCETEDGDVFSIYDWKEGRPIEDNEEIEWHIGAKNGAIANKAKAAIESYMDLNEDMSKGMEMDIADKWDKIPGEEKEAMLDTADEAGEGLADYAYMGWAMVPAEVKDKISDAVMAAKVAEPEPDEDEKMAAMAMKRAKSSKSAMKGVTADWSIDDILDAEDDDTF